MLDIIVEMRKIITKIKFVLDEWDIIYRSKFFKNIVIYIYNFA